jgi:hypothetical protein
MKFVQWERSHKASSALRLGGFLTVQDGFDKLAFVSRRWTNRRGGDSDLDKAGPVGAIDFSYLGGQTEIKLVVLGVGNNDNHGHIRPESFNGSPARLKTKLAVHDAVRLLNFDGAKLEASVLRFEGYKEIEIQIFAFRLQKLRRLQVFDEDLDQKFRAQRFDCVYVHTHKKEDMAGLNALPFQNRLTSSCNSFNLGEVSSLVIGILVIALRGVFE